MVRNFGSWIGANKNADYGWSFLSIFHIFLKIYENLKYETKYLEDYYLGGPTDCKRVKDDWWNLTPQTLAGSKYTNAFLKGM